MWSLILGLFIAVLLVITIILSSIDYFRNKYVSLKERISVTFIIPCFNDGKTIENAILNVRESYENAKIIVVNDCSTDDSAQILAELNKKYDFVLCNNKVNFGKAEAINRIIHLVDTEIFFVIDADVRVNEKAVCDILARFEANEKLGGVSARYSTKEDGFWSLMQNVEYHMAGLLYSAYNLWSAPALWGGCMAVRKKAFEEVGMFSKSAIIEDVDMAYKLIEAGYKIEQTWNKILTETPTNLKAWWKQKLRWNSGGIQCMSRHIGVVLRNPLFVTMLVAQFLFIISGVVSLSHGVDVGKEVFVNYQNVSDSNMTVIYHSFYDTYAVRLTNVLFYKLLFTLFSLPYVVLMIHRKKDLFKLLLVFPFTVIYYPLLGLSTFVGGFIYIKRYGELKAGARAW